MLQVAAIGEVLLDLLPTGVRLGGMPAAAAWYLAEMGARGLLVSAVGNDKHGRRVLQEVEQRHMPAEYIEGLLSLPTGERRVHYDENGKTCCRFLEDAAWDYLSMTPHLKALAPVLDGVIYGALGQRAAASRRTVWEFLDRTRPDAVRLLDLQSCAPYYEEELLAQSFRRATAAKISQSGLQAAARWLGTQGAGPQETARVLLERYPSLCVVAQTRGENGSILFGRSGVWECGGFYADQMVNSSGCGAAFSAVLCMGLLNGADLERVNEEANRAACCVCREADALAPLSDEVLDSLQKAHII